MIERAGFSVAQKPRDLRKRQVLFAQIAFGEIKSQIVQDLTKRQAFVGEASRQRSPAHPEFRGNLADPRLAVR